MLKIVQPAWALLFDDSDFISSGSSSSMSKKSRQELKNCDLKYLEKQNLTENLSFHNLPELLAVSDILF